MKQIYHFDAVQPPALDERALCEESRRRDTARRVCLLRIASLLYCLALACAAWLLRLCMPEIALLCLAAIAVTLAGSGIIFAVFNRRKYLYA